uniref:Uncharacterized protein n=1 Tax=viral metagenome TaxID=1070528 RepID=A0A6M3K2M8_9ZZZZ
MSKVGDIKKIHLSKHIFSLCACCGKGRWTRLWSNKPKAELCRRCSALHNLVLVSHRPRFTKEERIERRRKGDRERYQARKQDVLKHYGGDPPKCAHCGITDIDVLCIDHINGGGRKHYLELQAKNIIMQKWLQDNGYPEGYQILCANCNLKKEVERRRNGYSD